jgi:hypothetical protein
MRSSGLLEQLLQPQPTSCNRAVKLRQVTDDTDSAVHAQHAIPHHEIHHPLRTTKSTFTSVHPKNSSTFPNTQHINSNATSFLDLGGPSGLQLAPPTHATPDSIADSVLGQNNPPNGVNSSSSPIKTPEDSNTFASAGKVDIPALPSIRTNFPQWYMDIGCGSHGLRKYEPLHPGLAFGTPQYANLKLNAMRNFTRYIVKNKLKSLRSY